MSDINENPLFDEAKGQALARQNDAAAVARATQEIQASLVIAQTRPRDEIKAKARILEACRRKGLAEVAEYEYSRGGSRITGPTIDLLRAIANRWGNLLFGWAEVERNNGSSSIRCWAWDTQSNSRSERTFNVRHWRDTQQGGYELTDERDIYELLANMASRRVRACLEEVVDADVVEAAIDQCRRTLKEGEKTPLADRAVQLLNAFSEFGVTKAMIEKRLGNALDAVSENQIASLRRVYKSLKDGVGKREDYFKPDMAPPDFKDATPKPDPEPPKPTPEAPKVVPDPAQAPENPLPKPDNAGESLLKVIRASCKGAKIKERDLLGFLAEIGISDGSCATLEELALQNRLALDAVTKNWTDIREKLAPRKDDNAP